MVPACFGIIFFIIFKNVSEFDYFGKTYWKNDLVYCFAQIFIGRLLINLVFTRVK